MFWPVIKDKMKLEWAGLGLKSVKSEVISLCKKFKVDYNEYAQKISKALNNIKASKASDIRTIIQNNRLTPSYKRKRSDISEILDAFLVAVIRIRAMMRKKNSCLLISGDPNSKLIW